MTLPTATIVGWSVFLVSLSYHPFVFYYFWKYRHREAIKWNMPTMVFLTIVMGECYAISMAIVLLSSEHTPYPIAHMLPMAFLQASGDITIFICLELYFAFLRVERQLEFSTRTASYDRWIRRRIRLLRFLGSSKTKIITIAADMILVFVFQLRYIFKNPEVWVYRASQRHDPDKREISSGLAGIAFFHYMLAALLIMVIAFKIRIVVDGFGIKRMLKRCACVSLFGGMIPTMLFREYLNEKIRTVDSTLLWGCFLYHFFVYICIIEPLRKVRASNNQIDGTFDDQDEQIDKKNQILEDYIMTNQGYETFKEFLKTEFSVESILFWKAARAFYSEFRQSSSTVADRQKMSRRALQIYNNFIVDDAPMQINVPSTVRRNIEANLWPGKSATEIYAQAGIQIDTEEELLFNIDFQLFEEASHGIVRLLQMDSLQRFKKHKKYAVHWEAFMQACREKEALTMLNSIASSQAGTLTISSVDNCSPIGGTSNTFQV